MFIAFDDGAEWASRSLGDYGSYLYTQETAFKIIMSEAPTLMYLKKNTSIPVLEVYSFR
jgi:hypothetical protein